jgi:hypothetical protein
MSALQQARYKSDYIAAFENTIATLPPTVRNDTQDQGGSLIFLVSGSGGREAVTRGPRGIIPPSDNSQVQVTLNFKEAHDKRIMTQFNIFRAHGDQLKMMREESLAVIRRQQDKEIITALATGTVDLGTVAQMDLNTVLRISTRLQNADVGVNTPGNLFGLVTPAAFNYMLGNIVQFSNADYTATRAVDKGIPTMRDRRFWMGIEWMVHTDLPGNGTTAATCFVYHRDAVGYATSTRGIDAYLGYNEEDDYTIRRASLFHAAVKLQNAGIIKFTHNDEGLST